MEFIHKKLHRVQAAEGGGSFAEGCPSRQLAEGDVGKGYNGGSAGRIWIWLSWCSLVSMSHIEYWNLILGWSVAKSLVLLRCFAEAARKLRGSTAEGTHAQTTVPPAPMPSESVQAQGKRTYQKKKAKMKGNEGPKGQNERKWNQPQPETARNLGKRSGAVVAEAKTKKTCSRKLAEGIYVKCVSRKLALWLRKHGGSCCGSGE